eukprot:5885180-Pyramimonas_sp.AAC.1
MRGNPPGVSSQAQQHEMMDDDEHEVQRAATETERKRAAEKRALEATRRMLLESQGEARKPPLQPKAKSET